MNINNEMRAECAKVLTHEIFIPQIEAIRKALQEEGHERVAAAIVKAVMGRADYSRFDDLKPGDVPQIETCRISFDDRCCERTANTNYGHSHRSNSPEERRSVMVNALRRPIGLYADRHVKLPTPIKVPYRLNNSAAFTLEATRTRDQSDDRSEYKVQLSVGKLGGTGRDSTSDRLLIRLFKKYEKQHAIAADGIDFYDNLVTQLATVRTLKALKEKMPDLHSHFIRINNIDETGTKLSTEVVDPVAVKQLNHLLKKHDHALTQVSKKERAA